MVKHESRCETSAIPEATVVSLPYALGITMVLSPRGIATEHTVQITKACHSVAENRGGRIANIPIKRSGNAIRRKKLIA